MEDSTLPVNVSNGELRDATEDVVNDRQQSQIEDLLSLAEEYGPFDPSTGANGAHYAPADANPFVGEGLICANCELYQPISETEGRCAIVEGPLDSGHVEPNAVCKLWVIPESKLAPAAGTREDVVKKETRVIAERDIRENPALVAELREGADLVERRLAPVTTEIREAPNGGWILTGHAAVFGSESGDLGGFREVIQRGAFRKVLKRDNLDVAALFNHDQNQILARTTNGTLTLREDPRGLVYEATVADTSYGRDLKVLLERGDVSQSSFAFRVRAEGQVWTDAPDGTMIRTITEFDDLLDVSPVVFPAYSDTTSVALTRGSDSSSTSESEQVSGGTVGQPSSQADSQPRRADDEGTHRHRARRLKLRDKRAA
jgi:HK97 family phage prohead protease